MTRAALLLAAAGLLFWRAETVTRAWHVSKLTGAPYWRVLAARPIPAILGLALDRGEATENDDCEEK